MRGFVDSFVASSASSNCDDVSSPADAPSTVALCFNREVDATEPPRVGIEVLLHRSSSAEMQAATRPIHPVVTAPPSDLDATGENTSEVQPERPDLSSAAVAGNVTNLMAALFSRAESISKKTSQLPHAVTPLPVGILACHPGSFASIGCELESPVLDSTSIHRAVEHSIDVGRDDGRLSLDAFDDVPAVSLQLQRTMSSISALSEVLVSAYLVPNEEWQVALEAAPSHEVDSFSKKNSFHQRSKRVLQSRWGQMVSLSCLVGIVLVTGLIVVHRRNDRLTNLPIVDVPPSFSTTEELYSAVDFYLGTMAGQDAFPIGTWDVSRITNFSRLFDATRNAEAESFNEDISGWNLSSAMTLLGMFANAKSFNGNRLSRWDTTSVRDMSRMFHGALRFQGDVSTWNVARVVNMSRMFESAVTFRSDLSAWDVSMVSDMSGLFDGALLFSSDLSSWNVSLVQDMSFMFRRAQAFSSDLSMWDVSAVTTLQGMFAAASAFSSDLSSWDVSAVMSTRDMFVDAVQFSSQLSSWNVTQVQDASSMLQRATAFSHDLCAWSRLLPTDALVEEMFLGSACPKHAVPVVLPFGPLCHACDVPHTPIPLTSTDELYRAVDGYMAAPDDEQSLVALVYGYPIGTWDVSRLTDFSRLFDPDRSTTLFKTRVSACTSSFNEDISEWDMSSATTLTGMFACASAFNGNLSTWNTSSAVNMDYMFASASEFNADISLWDVSEVTSMAGMFYSATAFHANLSSWNVGRVVDMSSMFENAISFTCDLSSWDVGAAETMNSLFAEAHVLESDLSMWNVSRVQGMNSLFLQARRFTSDLSRWDVGRVSDMGKMFGGVLTFESDLSAWNVSGVVTMEDMFRSAELFSSNLSAWDVSKVQTMTGMFHHALMFRGDVSSWNVAQVESMRDMFYHAKRFDSNISAWNVSSAVDISNMFRGALLFNQDLCAWGPLLAAANATTTGAFTWTACSSGAADPVLPMGPLCTPCPARPVAR